MTHPAFEYPPLLCAGDHMSLDEFLDRWHRMPGLRFAELIDKTVYMPSPVSNAHMGHDSHIQLLCGYYAARTRGVKAGTNGTWIMTASSAPQPDCSLFIRPEFGGRSTVRNNLSVGVPEFVSEICRSSRAYDLGPKLALYQLAGVDEYLAVLDEERRLEWRVLVDGSFQFIEAVEGIYRSRVFPGFWVDETAFWNDDSEALLRMLEQGIASHEHADFLKTLQPIQ